MYKLLITVIIIGCILYAGCAYNSYDLSYQKYKNAVRKAKYYNYLGVDRRIFGNWKLMERREKYHTVDDPHPYTTILSELDLRSDGTFDYKRLINTGTGPWLFFNEDFSGTADTLEFSLSYEETPYREFYAYKIMDNVLLLKRTGYDTIPGLKIAPLLPEKMYLNY